MKKFLTVAASAALLLAGAGAAQARPPLVPLPPVDQCWVVGPDGLLTEVPCDTLPGYPF